MDEFVKELKKELHKWIEREERRHRNSRHGELDSQSFLIRYSYECCVKMEIIRFFENNAIMLEIQKKLYKESNGRVLEYLYNMYIKQDSADIHNEISSFLRDCLN